MTWASGTHASGASMSRRPCRLIDDVEVSPPPELGRHRGEDGAHRLRGAPLLADDLPDVVLRDAKLDDAVVITGDLGDLHLIGLVDQLHGDGVNQIFERHDSTDGYLAATAGAAASAAT